MYVPMYLSCVDGVNDGLGTLVAPGVKGSKAFGGIDGLYKINGS